MTHIRELREAKGKEGREGRKRKSPALASSYAKVAEALNSMPHALRRGDRLSLVPLQEKKQKMQKKRWEHANAWSLEASLKLGFRGVGKVVVERSGMGGTCRTNLATVVTASLAQDLQLQAVETQLIDNMPGKIHALVLCRHHDATPFRVNFGALDDFGPHCKVCCCG